MSRCRNFNAASVVSVSDSEIDYLDVVSEILDLTWSDDEDFESIASSQNGDASGHRRLSRIQWMGEVVKPGVLVQIPRLSKTNFCADFIRVTSIYRKRGDGNATMVRGIPLTRTKYLDGIVNWDSSYSAFEVALVLSVARDDNRSYQEQGAVEVRLSNVKGVRNVIYTNAPFPEFKSNKTLICRWKYVRYFPNARARQSCSPLRIEGEITPMPIN